MIDSRTLDTIDQYKINVQEIVDNWNGYPLKEQCDGAEALNAGTIQLRCFINNSCPFVFVSPKHDTLVFNESTLLNVLPGLPDSFRNILTVTPGTEGLHIKPRYVFRNNYVYMLNPLFNLNDMTEQQIIDSFSSDNFDDYYVEVFEGRGLVGSADKTRYKKEQSWIIEPSIFDDLTIPDEEGECIRSRWIYEDKKESSNEVRTYDFLHDYDNETYNNYLLSTRKEEDISPFNPNNEVVEAPFIPNIIQMPRQTRTSDSTSDEGIHWRLRKRTPLYKGEDFFIKFHKTSKSSTEKKENTNVPKFKLSEYGFLDVTNESTVLWNEDFLFAESGTPINYAIRPVPNSKGEVDEREYDFSSQAYYIIELGYKDEKNNYFIIINERSSPICVNIQRGISVKIGEFKDVSGKQLIDLDNFIMTVRNHLGTLVIEFEGPGFKPMPWVIQKEVLEMEIGEKSFIPIITSKPAIFTVPRGQMTIWGGNLNCGFLFGPLQYTASQAGFGYPPQKTGTNLFTANSDGNINLTSEGDVDSDSNTPVSSQVILPQPFFLPMGVNHHISLSSTDIDKYEFEKEIAGEGKDSIKGDRRSNVSMFNQDAQFYREYHETWPNRVRKPDKYGAYFYKETLKEIGLVATTTTPVKTSGLTVFKDKYVNDNRSRQQAFNIVIHMLVGDHVFSLEDNISIPSPDTGRGKGQWDVVRRLYSTDLNDNEWVLNDCKTPILTTIRLESEAGFVPRWDDGTIIATGVGATPFDNSSPYFIDATNHVLEYSDSWASTDYTQMDHNGSISFLLNQDQPFADNNVTNKLFALQNRTFYIDIWAGYIPCSYSKVNGFFKLFTGLCHGGKINYQYGKTIMNCEIVDYTAVLEDQLFFNSPFFDGMRDINAVNDILKMAGFRNVGSFDPGSLVNNLSRFSDSNGSTVYFHHIDGRLFKMETYTLPSAYNRLSQPMFKFDDGTNYLDAIKEICKKSAKVFFFDQMGIAHYEDFGDLIEQDFQGKMPLNPLYKFTTNPELFPGQMVFNAMERNYVVEDIFNHIKMMSNTPDMHLLLLDTLNWSSMDNPDVEGFIGYLKTFYQQEGIFGSKAALVYAVRKYGVMFRPAILHSFETYGVPLRANDIVQINGENVRVMKVDHSLDPKENKWWMTVESKRYQPIA